MEWERLTEDQLDELIVDAERSVARLRAVEMAAIAEKRRRGTHLEDGYRSMIDWVAARADIAHRSARRLVWTASRLASAPEIAGFLAGGEMSFDRAEQVSRLPERQRDDHERFDIGQLQREVALHRKLSRKREEKICNSGYLQFQPSLDETVTRFWGELPGVDARTVAKAIDQAADEIVPDEGRNLAVAERRALGLVAISQDHLYEGNRGVGADFTRVTVTVDARSAAQSNAQSGVAVQEGPKIGRQALNPILCDTIIEVIGLTETGQPLNLGRKTRTVTPRLRRHVLTRDHGCTVDGCNSRYRLQVHHVVPWSQGGPTSTDNLITLCWYHHHIAVHRDGLGIRRIGTSRVRLVKPGQGRSPPGRLAA